MFVLQHRVVEHTIFECACWAKIRVRDFGVLSREVYDDTDDAVQSNHRMVNDIMA